jgi:hypothetical protein
MDFMAHGHERPNWDYSSSHLCLEPQIRGPSELLPPSQQGQQRGTSHGAHQKRLPSHSEKVKGRYGVNGNPGTQAQPPQSDAVSQGTTGKISSASQLAKPPARARQCLCATAHTNRGQRSRRFLRVERDTFPASAGPSAILSPEWH